MDGYMQKLCKRGRQEGRIRQREKLTHHVTAAEISAYSAGILRGLQMSPRWRQGGQAFAHLWWPVIGCGLVGWRGWTETWSKLLPQLWAIPGMAAVKHAQTTLPRGGGSQWFGLAGPSTKWHCTVSVTEWHLIAPHKGQIYFHFGLQAEIVSLARNPLKCSS